MENCNRTLRAAYGIVQGEAEHHPEGTYYLRYLCQGKRAWKSIGSNADAAVAAARNVQHELEALDLGRRPDLPMAHPSSSGRELPARRSLAEATRHTWTRSGSSGRPRPSQRGRICSAAFWPAIPTAQSMTSRARTCLITWWGSGRRGSAIGPSSTTSRGSLPFSRRTASRGSFDGRHARYDEKEVRAYNADELATLFAAASADERLLFHFLLGTGFRDGEVMHCTWRDVDFKGQVISARSKPEMASSSRITRSARFPYPTS